MNTSGKNRTGYQGATIALLAALLIGLPASADDTELYFGKSSPDTPAPLVMLTLDLRPNLGSPFCNEVASPVCRAEFCGSATADPGCAIGQGIYDALYPGAPQDNGIYTGADDASGAVNLRQSFVAAFRYLLFNLGSFDGMKVGLMMNHNAEGNNSRCAPGDTGCSNGGYVLRGFELLEKGTDSNGAKQELLDIFGALPDMSENETHKYQGRELFFELYRYMAGLDVLNAKLGYTDFGGSTGKGGSPPTRNLDYEFSTGFGGPPATKCLFTDPGPNSGDNRRCLNYIDPETGYTAAAGSNLTKDWVRISSALTWDPDIIHIANGKDRYISPYSNDEDWSCSGAYSINMLFGVSNQDADSDTALAENLEDQGLGVPKPTGNACDDSQPCDGFSQVIAKLHQMDIAGGQAGAPSPAGRQNLTSWFLTADTGPITSKGNDYARAGGTDNAIPALNDPGELVAALDNIGSQINAVSSSFVAVTVPVNADNRVTSLPNLFVALFQVDENGKPYWPGNVKKLDIVTTTNASDGSKQLNVNDALGAAAFNPITGRLNDSALTLWTVPSAVDTVFPADPDKSEVPGRDGSSVRRGGAGHKIPGYQSGSVGLSNDDGARQIFLGPSSFDPLLTADTDMVPLNACDDSTLCPLQGEAEIQALLGIQSDSCTGTDEPYCMDFITDVLTAAEASTTGTNAEKAARATQVFLKWVRGFDVFDEDTDSTTEHRPWLMGDVLHSRPLAVNYGARPPGGTGYSEFNQDVRLIFGSNDGLLRMVRNTASISTKPLPDTQEGAAYGQEVWAFMPRELLAHVPRLAMTTSDVGLNRPYGVDGQPTLLTIDTNGDGIIDNDGSCTVGDDDCDRAWVYFGLRRGGKSYYAVDISNPDAITPNLLWKIDDSPADFTELGMTFSSPRVGWVRFEDDASFNQFGLTAATAADAAAAADPTNTALAAAAAAAHAAVTNVPVPVVIFGGGYHGHAVTSGDHHQSGTGGPSKDTILGTPFTGADTNEGNAIFIVHARSGELIWKATLGASTGAVDATEYTHVDMQHGVAAPVSPMDSDGDGILDRLYVADTGGRVWRVDLPEFVPGISSDTHREDTWKATVLADLRPADLSATPNDDLRFFHGATLVRRARDGVGVHDAIAVGSGDREHPQSETNKDNWFFLLKDRITTSGDTAVATRTPYLPTNLRDVTDACFTGSSSPTCSDGDLSKGWRLALEETGEKNLSEPFIGGNGIIFTTYLPLGDGPDDAQCVPLGESRLYQVSLETGAPLRFLHNVVGNTFSKTDRWINLYSGIDGGVVAVSPDFWITSTGKSGKNPPQKPIRFYWRESGVDAVK